jgi:molybdopterin molybdotransferase
MERLRKIGFSKLTSLEDAWKVLENLIKLCPNQEIEINNALNRILATNIESSFDIPPFERSAMDGYAVKAEDTFGASPKNPKKINLIGKIEIGQYSQKEINKGEAIRISTGAAIPKGADAVIKIEDTEIEKDIITLYTSLVPGKNVSKKGEDILKGTSVLKAGIELKPEHIALLCALGNDKIQVKAQPKVSVFATGDELIEVGNPLEPNKIYNSNTPMISNLVKLYGGTVIREFTLGDNKDIIQDNLIKAQTDSQVIIFTGGTSVGTKDYLPEVIAENGNVVIHGIAMRPGSPILIGYTNESLIFCLPGTPVAAYIGFLTIVGPTIRKLMGSIFADPRTEIIATLDKDVPVSSMGYINHLRVKIEKIKEDFKAIPVKLKGSGVISSLTEANGIVEIPAFQEGFKKGTKVIVKLFPK